MNEKQIHQHQCDEVEQNKRECYFKTQVKSIYEFMEGLPFQQNRLRDVDPALVYPAHYTDSKGNGWRDHWYNMQQKQRKIAEEAELNAQINFKSALRAISCL